MAIVGKNQSRDFRIPAKAAPTVAQVVAVDRPIKLLRWAFAVANEPGTITAPLTLTIERQTGGKFANMGLVPERVRGADRPGELLSARYRTIVLKEPETVEELSATDDLAATTPQDVTLDPPVTILPGEAVGFRLSSPTGARIAYMVIEHEE